MTRLSKLIPVVFLLVLAGCAALEGEVISDPATAPVIVDPAAAARMLSAIRAREGLGPVTVSPALNAIAQDYADLLAERGVVTHTEGGTFGERLEDAGYQWLVAAENLGGGYRSLEEAFDYWYASRPHRANLLAEPVTRIGIATAFNINSPYRNFWVLILALPDTG